MFEFVTVQHPDEIKDRSKQGKLRQHAIRTGIQKSRADRAKKTGGIVVDAQDAPTPRPLANRKAAVSASKQPSRKKSPVSTKSPPLLVSPAASAADPFDTLGSCPERFRSLMRQSPASVSNSPSAPTSPASTLSDQSSNAGTEVIFRKAASDPALGHVLSLVLELNTNNPLPYIEILSHRGYLLHGIRHNIKNQDDTPKVSTLVAMLMVIGYEYRMDGANGQSIGMHIDGVQSLVKMCEAKNLAVIEQMHKALFFQDLISCLFAGTPRMMSHTDFIDYRVTRDLLRQDRYVVPPGFLPDATDWPSEFISILEDVNGLCQRVEEECNEELAPLDVFAIDNYQANLQSRIVDCLNNCRQPQGYHNALYEACIHASYICAFKLSPGVWEGCYIPEVCVNQIFRCVEDAVKDGTWQNNADMVLWLLCISGGTTSRPEARRPIARMIQRLFEKNPNSIIKDWNKVQAVLRRFLWSGYALEQKIRYYWQCLQPMPLRP